MKIDFPPSPTEEAPGEGDIDLPSSSIFPREGEGNNSGIFKEQKDQGPQHSTPPEPRPHSPLLQKRSITSRQMLRPDKGLLMGDPGSFPFERPDFLT